MPGGMRVYTNDPENDPDYEDALARYVSANPDSPDAQVQRALLAPAAPADVAGIQVRRAPAGGGAPPPMTQPAAAALRSMAPGASLPRRIVGPTLTLGPGGSIGTYSVGNPPPRPVGPEVDSVEIGYPTVERRVPDVAPSALRPEDFAALHAAPPPTPAGEATFRDLQAAGRASIPPSNMFTAGLQGLKQVAPYVGNAIMRMGGMDTGPILPDSTPAAPTAPGAAPPPPSVVDGTLPPAKAPPAARPAGPARPLTAQQGANIMATLRGPVADIVKDASGVPPAPSGVTPPGAPTGPASSVPPAALARAREVLGPAPQKVDPLQLALAASRGDRLIANLARAGGTAIGRGTGPGYDALDEGADRPLQEMGLVQQQADKAKAEALANGPLSPAEQSVYGKLLAQAGVNLDPAMLAKLPAGRVRALIPDLEKMGQLEATRADKAAALKQAATEAEQNRQNHLDVARLAHAGTAGLREDRLQEQKDKRLDAEVERLGKDVEPLTKLKPDLSYLRSVASKTGDIAGTGVLASRAPDWMLSDEGVKTRQALLRVASVYLSQQSGQNVTPSEAERFLKSRGMGAGATARSLRTGLAEMLPEFEAMAQSRISRHTPEAVREYKTRGGETDYSLGGAPSAGWSDADEKRLQELEAKARAGR